MTLETFPTNESKPRRTGGATQVHSVHTSSVCNKQRQAHRQSALFDMVDRLKSKYLTDTRKPMLGWPSILFGHVACPTSVSEFLFTIQGESYGLCEAFRMSIRGTMCGTSNEVDRAPRGVGAGNTGIAPTSVEFLSGTPFTTPCCKATTGGGISGNVTRPHIPPHDPQEPTDGVLMRLGDRTGPSSCFGAGGARID